MSNNSTHRTSKEDVENGVRILAGCKSSTGSDVTVCRKGLAPICNLAKALTNTEQKRFQLKIHTPCQESQLVRCKEPAGSFVQGALSLRGTTNLSEKTVEYLWILPKGQDVLFPLGALKDVLKGLPAQLPSVYEVHTRGNFALQAIRHLVYLGRDDLEASKRFKLVWDAVPYGPRGPSQGTAINPPVYVPAAGIEQSTSILLAALQQRLHTASLTKPPSRPNICPSFNGSLAGLASPHKKTRQNSASTVKRPDPSSASTVTDHDEGLELQYLPAKHVAEVLLPDQLGVTDIHTKPSGQKLSYKPVVGSIPLGSQWSWPSTAPLLNVEEAGSHARLAAPVHYTVSRQTTGNILHATVSRGPAVFAAKHTGMELSQMSDVSSPAPSTKIAQQLVSFPSLPVPADTITNTVAAVTNRALLPAHLMSSNANLQPTHSQPRLQQQPDNRDLYLLSPSLHQKLPLATTPAQQIDASYQHLAPWPLQPGPILSDTKVLIPTAQIYLSQSDVKISSLGDSDIAAATQLTADNPADTQTWHVPRQQPLECSGVVDNLKAACSSEPTVSLVQHGRPSAVPDLVNRHDSQVGSCQLCRTTASAPQLVAGITPCDAASAPARPVHTDASSRLPVNLSPAAAVASSNLPTASFVARAADIFNTQPPAAGGFFDTAASVADGPEIGLPCAVNLGISTILLHGQQAEAAFRASLDAGTAASNYAAQHGKCSDKVSPEPPTPPLANMPPIPASSTSATANTQSQTAVLPTAFKTTATSNQPQPCWEEVTTPSFRNHNGDISTVPTEVAALEDCRDRSLPGLKPKLEHVYSIDYGEGWQTVVPGTYWVPASEDDKTKVTSAFRRRKHFPFHDAKMYPHTIIEVLGTAYTRLQSKLFYLHVNDPSCPFVVAEEFTNNQQFMAKLSTIQMLQQTREGYLQKALAAFKVNDLPTAQQHARTTQISYLPEILGCINSEHARYIVMPKAKTSVLHFMHQNPAPGKGEVISCVIDAILAKSWIEYAMPKDQQLGSRELFWDDLQLRGDGNVTVSDWAPHPSEACETTTDTMTPATSAFMAPEVSMGERSGSKTMMWSVGCMLHQVAVGRPPFRNKKHRDAAFEQLQYFSPTERAAGEAEVLAPPLPVTCDLGFEFMEAIRSCLRMHHELRPTARQLLNMPGIRKRLTPAQMEGNPWLLHVLHPES